LTEWPKALEGEGSCFIVCSGGSPGIIEAAKRSASEAAGINAGLNILLPLE
jgi:predicted Rossmann-fold nucleotide-binding protein